MSWYLYKSLIKTRGDEAEGAALVQYRAERTNAADADPNAHTETGRHLARASNSGNAGAGIWAAAEEATAE